MESVPAVTSQTSKTGHKSNRRQGNRHRLEIPATLFIAGDPLIEVTVTELSVGGVGLLSKTSLKLNAVYRIDSFDTLIPPGMKVRIVSQRPSAEGGFEVGAKAL